MFLRRLTGFSRIHGGISKGALEGSSNTNLRELEISPHVKGGRPFRNVILTLDPNKFAEKKQLRLRIGNLQAFFPRISFHIHSSPIVAPRMEYDLTNTEIHLPYPTGTKAFLYYSMPPDKPRIAAELRLRVTPSDDPASFKSGSDLLRSDGQPWSRPLYLLPKYYSSLYEKLREDQLVSDDLDRVLSTLPSKSPCYRRSRQRLYTLNDTFTVDFSGGGSFFFITEKGMETLPFFKVFFDRREIYKSTPYTGTALARFERSTLLEHVGKRTVVLRFLKMITPVKCIIPSYDGHICRPEEGELYRRSRYNSLEKRMWSVNIDNKFESKGSCSIIQGLRLLWDT